MSQQVPGFRDVTVPEGTTLWHATRASFLGLPTSPKGDRPAWFGLDEKETHWYGAGTWKPEEAGAPRIIEAVAEHGLRLPAVRDYGNFARALGVAGPVTPEILFKVLSARGICGWAVASATEIAAIALVHPHRCGVRFVRSAPLSFWS